MSSWCPNCGRQLQDDEKFCRRCGFPLHLEGDAASDWVMSNAPESRPTEPVSAIPTAPAAPPATDYIPPTNYYTPPQPPQYYPPAPTPTAEIKLGDWLSYGWQVYKENWMLMSMATLLGGFLGAVTIGILAGPLLMGLYRMAFKTMRGERPQMADLFNWDGRFLQAFLAFLIYFLISAGISGAGSNSALAALMSFVVTPFLTVMLGLTMPLILEHDWDISKAINEIGRRMFTKDAFMWWIVGLVFAAIGVGGFFACGIGGLVTIPWMVSSSAIAYRDIFGFDDPNRTNP